MIYIYLCVAVSMRVNLRENTYIHTKHISRGTKHTSAVAPDVTGDRIPRAYALSSRVNELLVTREKELASA